MRIIDQLVYKITADTAQAEKGLDTTEKKFDAVGKVAKVAMGVVTVGAVLKTVKSLADLAVQSTVTLDRVDKMSQKIGMSRDGFQEWDYILKQNGASVDGLQMSMKTLSTQADQVVKGNKESTEMFKKLGVEVTDVNGKMKDQEQLFNEVFLALSNLESETERTALAGRLLGRSATELAPAMNQGSDAIEKLRKEAHTLGLVYTDEVIDAGVKLGDNMLRLNKAFDAFKVRAIAPVVAGLVTITDKMLGQTTVTDDLEFATDELTKSTKEYKDVSDLLADTQTTLTDTERALLLARKESLAFEINRQLLTLATTYQKTKESIEDLQLEEEKWGRRAKERVEVLKNLEVGSEEYILQQEYVADALQRQNNAQEKLSDAQISFNSLIERSSQLVADGVLDVSHLADVNQELHDRIVDGTEAIIARNKGLDEANAKVKEFVNLTDEQLNALILESQTMLQAQTDTRLLAYYTELLEQAKAELYRRNEDLLASEEELSDEIEDGTDALEETLSAYDKWLDSLQEGTYLLGITGDKQAFYSDMVASTTRALVELRKEGLSPSSTEYQRLLGLLEEYTEKTKVAKEETVEWKDSTIDTLREIAGAFTALGSLMSGVHQQRLRELDEALQRELADKGLLEETEREKLQRELKMAKEAGDEELAYQKDIALQRLGIEEQYDEEKRRLQLEDAKRQKALAIFQAIIDTASAVIRAMPNIPLMALAGATGALQLGAIQAQPLPSFDVGSLRIERDTQAIVHKNEMILPASLSDQARKEGITISPQGSQDIHLQVMLDSKPIIDTTLKGINSGSYGKIDARVVK